MIRILLNGAGGKMGAVVAEIVKKNKNMQVVCGVDAFADPSDFKFPLYQSLDLSTEKADVVIDFSHFSVVPNVLKYCVDKQTPAVICTTGIDDELTKAINIASEKVAIFRSGNMSLGINLLIDLAKRATSVLGDNFDVEIIEKHHNRKVDAPSGTAFMIAQGIESEKSADGSFVYGRHGKDAKRKPDEIGIHAVRGGTIVGEHTVIFAGNDEIIEIRHSATSRNVFAEGAVKAAEFLSVRGPGLYDMNSILKG
ncbi:MAG: 4-hydroxy-tetrahydrodipicolinate reductase [Peptostreptococcaceae bacterium]|nr:4-hydroxy-tetrahydrodipicolinate reductase [Peptostreptococcaceae bacterium]